MGTFKKLVIDSINQTKKSMEEYSTAMEELKQLLIQESNGTITEVPSDHFVKILWAHKLGDPVKVEHIILAWNWVEKFLFEA